MQNITHKLAAMAISALTLLAGQAGAQTRAITDASELLFVYDQAVDAGRFDEALNYAMAGCEQLQVLYLCREVADLPLQMASQGIVPPARYASEQRRVAAAVCAPGRRMISAKGADFTGFICNYFARQFAHAHAPARLDTFKSRAWQHLEAIHDVAFANNLYQVACNHDSAEACSRLRSQEGRSAAGGEIGLR